MLKSYQGSVAFLEEHRLAVGAENPIVATTQHAEVIHLTKIFRFTSADRDDVTALLKAIRSDANDTFSPANRRALIETASSCLSNTNECDIISDGVHGSKKEQTHLTSYNYYTDDTWASFCSKDKPVKQKMNVMSKEWLR